MTEPLASCEERRPLAVAGRAVGSAFKAASVLRGAKSLHPYGVVYEAALAVDGDAGVPPAKLFRTPGTSSALVRFSASLGLPRPLPDLLGMSLRVIDAYGPGCHQDLLMVSSADRPIAHHVFLPADDVQRRPYSSSLPYRAGGELFLVGALPRADSPRPAGSGMYERLEAAAQTGKLAFDLAVAPLMGRFRPVGRLHVGKRLAPQMDALRFNPLNTGGGLRPAGDPLNRLRPYAYSRSQEGWAP
jgi:hypothetical protein